MICRPKTDALGMEMSTFLIVRIRVTSSVFSVTPPSESPIWILSFQKR